MGIAASREFGIESDEGIDLESFLKNPKVPRRNVFPRARVADFIQNLSRWKLFYEQLPLKSQRSIRKITSPQKEGSLSKVQRVRRSDIGISKKLRPHFQSWRNPKRFLDSKSPVVEAVAAAQDTVSQVYVELRRIVDRRVDDPIRARIYAVALFDLRLLLDKSDSLRLRPEVREKIEQVIFDSPLVADSLDDISKWTKMFLRFGERMKTIAAGNGGFGALIVIPSSLLSVRQWCRINDVEFDRAVQHLQSIKVARVAKTENAHGVANRIHSLILQKFTFGNIDKLDADYDEQMADEEVGEEVEDSDENSTEDEEISDGDDGSSVTSQSALTKATSVDSSQGALADQAANPRKEFSGQLGLEQQMMIGNPTCPPHSAGAFVAEQTNGTSNISPLEFLSEAANLVQNWEQAREINLISTAPMAEEVSASFISNCMRRGQVPNLGTVSNGSALNDTNNPFAISTYPEAAAEDLTEYDLLTCSTYPDVAPGDLREYDLLTCSTYPDVAPGDQREYDLLTCSTYPDVAPGDLREYDLLTCSTYPKSTTDGYNLSTSSTFPPNSLNNPSTYVTPRSLQPQTPLLELR